MVGFYTAQPGSVTLEEQGTDAIPSSAGDVQSAVAGMALAANPTPRIVRATLGGGLDTELHPAVDPRTAGSDVDTMASERGAGPVMLSPEDANTRYGIKGALSFDKPVPEPVAAALHDTKHNQIVRQDVIDRRTPGIITGWAGRGVTSLAMGLLDPVNLAAGLVPGFGEARIAGALGLDIAGSVAARTGVRALAGASGGAVGMAALEPVNYLLDQHEHNDWTMGEALRNVAFGAVLGGALHTGIGALGDTLSRPPREVVEAGQETQAMAMRGAVAQVAEGRPVGVADAIDLAGALPEGYRESVPLEPSGTPRAHPYLPENEPRRLVTFIQREGGIRDPGGDVLAMLGRHQDRPGLINQNGHALDDMALRAWENGFFPEAGENRPDINALLDAMGEDLAGNARYSHLDEVAASNYREALAHNAEVARISFETGIPDTNLTREQFWDAVANHLSAKEVAKEISSLEAGHAAAFEEAERAAKAAGISEDRLYGKPRSLEDLEHEFRQEQAAGPARPGEGGDGESRPASGYPETLQDGLRQERGAPGAPGRGDAPGGIEPTAGAPGSDGGPTAAAERSLGQLRDAAGRPTGYPDAEVTARENAAMVERAPKVEDKPDADIQEAQRIADETTATIQAEIAAGRLTEEHLAPLREAEARFADEEAIARAMEEAAMCMRLS